LNLFLLLILPQLQQQNMSSTVLTTDDIWVITPCSNGEKRYFKSMRTQDMWRKLHCKKCAVCAGALVAECRNPKMKPFDGNTVESYKREKSERDIHKEANLLMLLLG